MGCHLCQNSTFFRHCVFRGYLHTLHGYLQKAWLFTKSMVIYEKYGYLRKAWLFTKAWLFMKSMLI